MILIVGLGNPGKRFEKTRHNLGFRVVDEFYRKKRKLYFFSDFKLKKDLNSSISEGKFNKKEIILAKPQTFINLSGRAIKKLIKNFHLNYAMAILSTSLWVIHDDIDLPLGKIRISISRGSAGHRGVESIIKELGMKNFVRFRIGIKNKKLENRKTKNFVLKKFTKEEEKIVKKIIKKTLQAIEISLKEGLEKAMNKFNR